MGKVTVSRHTYRGEGPDALPLAPLDAACGISGRFMTPEVEEMAEHPAAMETPREVHGLRLREPPLSSGSSLKTSGMRRRHR
jgi:hypothetical protein